MKVILGAAMTLVLAGYWTTSASATDPRFFGNYCGDGALRLCAEIDWGLFNTTECRTTDVNDIDIRLEHSESARGGLVTGQGTARVKGETINIVLAGAVTARGRLGGSMSATAMDPAFGWASLSEDGRELTIHAYNKTLSARKDLCNNTPPSVSFSYVPASPVPYGANNFVGGDVSDNETTYFPPERLHWTYDDGTPLPKYPTGLGAPITTLAPGPHTITFTATDGGGLSTSVSTQITVTNEPPNEPVIYKPTSTDLIRAGCDVNFAGNAYDPEEGFLSNLTWNSNRDGLIGHGGDIMAGLNTVGGHGIQLTARDSLGAARSAQRTVNVQASTGKCPPTVKIVEPDYRQSQYLMVISGEPVTFVGTATDTDDAAHTLPLQWSIEHVGSSQPPTLIADTTTFETTSLTAGGGQAVEYKITFTATDSDGDTGEDSVTIYVFSTPVL